MTGTAGFSNIPHVSNAIPVRSVRDPCGINPYCQHTIIHPQPQPFFLRRYIGWGHDASKGKGGPALSKWISEQDKAAD